MTVMENIIERAKKIKRQIVLPEATDIRVLKAAEQIVKEEIANIILIGNKEEILSIAAKENIDLTDCIFEEPINSIYYIDAVKTFYELRKAKGITLEEAKNAMLDEVYFGTMLVKLKKADGLVSGAIHSTADTLRPALQIIKGKEKGGLVSSFFLMEMPESRYEKAYIFSDCGLIPNPTSEELAKIAIEANNTYKTIIGEDPKVALLSYSTLGSAKSESIDKVIKAKQLVNETAPDVVVDGELQLDAAIDKDVAKLKAPNSKVAGSSNVLIFPDLEAGNIGYKLVERFGNAKAYGPITQGLASPVNDLSRGCSYMDIVGAVAITCIQVEK